MLRLWASAQLWHVSNVARRAEGDVEPFNIEGVEHAGATLRAAAELFHLPGCAGHITALDAGRPPVHVMLAQPDASS